MNIRFGGPPFENSVDTFRLDDRGLGDPIRWKDSRMIFVCSMTDLFHPEVSRDHQDIVMAIMAYASQHTFQILTKRPHLMLEYFSAKTLHKRLAQALAEVPGIPAFVRKHVKWKEVFEDAFKDGVPKHIWIGVTAENQKYFDRRMRYLSRIRAHTRFISAEPLLGAIDMDEHLDNIDWLIVGGESGAKARPTHPGWVRFLLRQCRTSNIPFHFKQWGNWAPVDPDCLRTTMRSSGLSRNGWIYPNGEVHVRHELGAAWMVKTGSKKRAGRELDGLTWDEHP